MEWIYLFLLLAFVGAVEIAIINYLFKKHSDDCNK